jgi:hypothetical protein
LSTTSFGVPFVAHSPCQNEMSMPEIPIASMVGTPHLRVISSTMTNSSERRVQSADFRSHGSERFDRGDNIRALTR